MIFKLSSHKGIDQCLVSDINEVLADVRLQLAYT